MLSNEQIKQPLRVGIGGPVGSAGAEQCIGAHRFLRRRTVANRRRFIFGGCRHDVPRLAG